METLIVSLTLAALAVVVLMLALLAHGMPVRRVPWFMLGAFALLTAASLLLHWAVGVAVAILGIGGVAALDGLMKMAKKGEDA